MQGTVKEWNKKKTEGKSLELAIAEEKAINKNWFSLFHGMAKAHRLMA